MAVVSCIETGRVKADWVLACGVESGAVGVCCDGWFCCEVQPRRSRKSARKNSGRSFCIYIRKGGHRLK